MKRLPLLLIVLAAIVLRLKRYPLRWNQIALAYAAYQEPFFTAFETGEYGAALSTFYGLHPPFYSVLFTLNFSHFQTFDALFYMSILASSVAVYAVGVAGAAVYGQTRGLMAAALMATSLYHLHYALELNNYPLLTALSALSVVAYLHWRRGGHFMGWVILTILNHWTHILAILISGVQALFMVKTRKRWQKARWPLIWVTLGSIPLLVKIVSLVGRSSTYHNEIGGLAGFYEAVIEAMLVKFGPLMVVFSLVILAGVGAYRGLGERRTAPETLYFLTALLIGVLGVALTTALGISAAHQHPYYLNLMPFLCLLIARALPLNPWGWSLLLLLLAPSLLYSYHEVDAAKRQQIKAKSQPHALRLALEADEGAHIWLIAPPLHPDDDKLAQDTTYDLLDPSWPCVFYKPVDFNFEYVDYRYGQPYLCNRQGGSPTLSPSGAPAPGNLIIYSFTDIYSATMPRLIDHIIEKRAPLKVILYDDHLSPEYHFKVKKLLELVTPALGASVEVIEIGATHLFEVEAS